MTLITARGHSGCALGRQSYIEPPPEWRAPTRQLAGLWPWAVGGTAPTKGVPLGHNIRTGRAVCGDPISWFRANLLSQPSWAVLGRPGLGKSTLVRRIALCLAAIAAPLILGDLKGEYVELIRLLGGQVITLGRGAGALNILDISAFDDAAARLAASGKPGAKASAEALRDEAHGRRLSVVLALIAIANDGAPATAGEGNILDVALKHLQRRWRRKLPPVLDDLIRLIGEGPAEVRAVALDRGDVDRYRDNTDKLMTSLMALRQGPLGSMFARQTTDRIRLDSRGVCMDVSSISDNDRKLQAGALLACWFAGFGTVEANNALADAGIIAQRLFLAIVDELWQVLRAGASLVEFANTLTRLNRDKGVGHIFASHSAADMPIGFLERVAAIACFGLPRRELRAESLGGVVSFTEEETDLLASWNTPPGWGEADEPPGRGFCVLKVGERPGIPLHVDLVEAEQGLHNTSRRWAA